MRGRSIRVLVLALLILGVSVAALGFKEIHIDVPGFPEVDRVGNGPLGLKLGLDLRGGGFLIYQADTDPRTEVTFAESVTVASVEGVLEELGFKEFDVVAKDGRTFTITTTKLDNVQRQELETTLAEKLGAIDSFRVNERPEPTVDDMKGVEETIKRRVNLFGTEQPIIQRFGDDRIIVQLPGASGAHTEVVFNGPPVDIDDEPVGAAELGRVLDELGYEDFEVDPQDDRTFRLKTVSLNASERQELQVTLAQRFGSIESFQVAGGIEQAKALIRQTARLELTERTCLNPSQDPLCTISFADEPISDPNLGGDDLIDAYATPDPVTSEWVVIIQFNSRGADLFSDHTQRIYQQPETKRTAFFLDEEAVFVPVARDWIRNGISQLSGNFTREEARNLAIQLKSGSLPVSLKLVQESDVDALLGAESLRKSLIAGLVGLGLVLVFMVVYYRMAGVVAALSLTFYAIIVLSIFKLFPITLTLSGIAGFLLSIGMAVDANILIFERMKEEVRIGRTLASSMEVGFNRAWPAIRDSNISTFITCGVLIWFGSRLGGELVTGFALTLFVGVAVSMFTAVVVSRNLLQVMAWIGLGRRINLFTPERIQRPATTMGRR